MIRRQDLLIDFHSSSLRYSYCCRRIFLIILLPVLLCFPGFVVQILFLFFFFATSYSYLYSYYYSLQHRVSIRILLPPPPLLRLLRNIIITSVFVFVRNLLPHDNTIKSKTCNIYKTCIWLIVVYGLTIRINFVVGNPCDSNNRKYKTLMSSSLSSSYRRHHHHPLRSSSFISLFFSDKVVRFFEKGRRSFS